jgi:predicted amino acid-binding ACT domain protein
VHGDNKPGAAAELTRKLAAAGINLRGLSAAVIGARFILYIGLHTAADAVKAVKILQKA